MQRIFILDDCRSITQAVKDSGIKRIDRPVYFSLVRPYRFVPGEGIVSSFIDAVEVIQYSERFDIWILDNDLGPSAQNIDGYLEGYKFLQQMCEEFPEKIPILVVSCSGNPVRRLQIQEYHKEWLKNIGYKYLTLDK